MGLFWTCILGWGGGGCLGRRVEGDGSKRQDVMHWHVIARYRLGSYAGNSVEVKTIQHVELETEQQEILSYEEGHTM